MGSFVIAATRKIRRIGLLLPLFPSICWAWGGTGHCAVAQIAADRLDANARRAVQELLGAQTLTDVANWADVVRKQPEYKWSDAQHCSRITAGFDEFVRSRDCPPEGCAVSAIDRMTGVLRDPAAGREQKIDALKFLVHFVGDIHNPLHMAQQGKGVGTNVKVTFFGQPASLHAVWDNSMIERAHKSWPEYARQLDERITTEQAKRWSELDPAVWATESYRLGRRVGYVVPADGALGEEYFSRCMPVVDERLSMAGVRLGLLLNFIFSHPASQPTATLPASGLPGQHARSQPASSPAQTNPLAPVDKRRRHARRAGD